MSVKKKRLGMGLESLVSAIDLDVSSIADAKEKGLKVEKLSCAKIYKNKYQPRKTFDKEKLRELSQSIKEHGLIQPILVSDNGNDSYELIAGERRLKATQLAGLNQISAIVVEYSEKQKQELALIENLQREDLNAIEIALAYKGLIEQLDLTQEELAKRVQKSRVVVTNTLRLLQLPESIQQSIVKGEISEGHARLLLSLNSLEEQLLFAKECIMEKYSVRKLEEKIKNKDVSRETSSRKVVKNKKLNILADQITEKVGTPVSIKGNGQKGKILISYSSKEELMRIAEYLKK